MMDYKCTMCGGDLVSCALRAGVYCPRCNPEMGPSLGESLLVAHPTREDINKAVVNRDFADNRLSGFVMEGTTTGRLLTKQESYALKPSAMVTPFNRDVDFFDTDSWEVNIEDVFRALPRINRFNGQTLFPYNVAQHSLNCFKIAKADYGIEAPHLLLAVLLHDAPECYTGDIIRPLKKLLSEEFFEIEEIIYRKFITGLELEAWQLTQIFEPGFVKILEELDTRCAVTEADVLLDIKILPDIPRTEAISVIPASDRDETQLRRLYNALLMDCDHPGVIVYDNAKRS